MRRRRGVGVLPWVGTAGLIFVFGAWVFGDLPSDPLAQTPLVIAQTEDVPRVTFQNFSPRFDHLEDGRLVTRFENGAKAVLTLDPALQTQMEGYFRRHQVPYGVFVAVQPLTGKVLAMAEYATVPSGTERLALRATYPAASIFKLVTAAAAIEGKKAAPDTVIAYRGSPYAMGPRVWADNPKRDRIKTTLARALADSNNVVFSKVALRWLSAPTLLHYGEQFGFNRPIPFDLPVQESQMRIEEGRAGLAEAATGFGKITLSPLHGAMIAAALGNDGVMMAPCLVDRVIDAEDHTRYQCLPKPIATLVSSQTAQSISQMMALTTLVGTSRKAFRTKRGAPSLRGMLIGGKTGSLTGDNPPGKYSWFVGMAPLSSPEIAVAALVINHPTRWKIKASGVAKEGLSIYFDGKRLHR